MKTAIFPGTFDPFTIGHLHLLEFGLQMFDEVVIAILANPGKKSRFYIKDRVSMISAVIEKNNWQNVEIHVSNKLLVEVAEQYGADAILRGVRGAEDCMIEIEMARVNALLKPGLKTVLIPADISIINVSSSLVRLLLKAKRYADATALVPTPVRPYLKMG